jgi:lipopolysaccharide export system permease protein
VFASLLLMLNFVGIINQGVLAGFSFYIFFESMLYLLPNIVAASLPLAFLLAMLLILGQMSRDGEVIALRAGGFSFQDILSGVLWTALLSVLLLVVLNNWAGPGGLKISGDYTETMLTRITKIDLKPRTFQQISDWVLYADRVNSLTGGMRGVKLVRRIDKTTGPGLVTKINAADGHYYMARAEGLGITLSNGQFSQTDCARPEKITCGRFDSYSTMLPFFDETGAGRKLGPKELTTPQLLARASAAGDADTSARYRVEAYSRFAMALAPLAFFLVGAPLGVSLDKRGRSAGFALALPIIFFYYGLTITGMVVSRKYAALFPWAMFVPALLTAGAGAWLWKRRLYAK